MKKILLPLIMAVLLPAFSHAQVILFQGFEGTPSDDWNFMPMPAAYNPGNGDVWAVVSSVGSGSNDIDPNTGNFFWGIRDTVNPAEGNVRHVLDFDQVDVSNYTNVEISFTYKVFDFSDENSGEIGYELVLDGGLPSENILLDNGQNN